MPVPALPTYDELQPLPCKVVQADRIPQRSKRQDSHDQRLHRNAVWQRVYHLSHDSIVQEHSNTKAHNLDRSAMFETDELPHPSDAALGTATPKSSEHQVDQSHSQESVRRDR